MSRERDAVNSIAEPLDTDLVELALPVSALGNIKATSIPRTELYHHR
jgi:hypothetical protein